MAQTPTPQEGGNRQIADKPSPPPVPPLPAEVREAIQLARAKLTAYHAGFGEHQPPGPVQRGLRACATILADALWYFDRAHQRPDGSPWA